MTMPRLPRLTALKLGLSVPRAPGICRVESPDRRFDLDHVGAEIGEHHRAEWAGHDLRDVEHAKTFERRCSCSSILSSAGAAQVITRVVVDQVSR